MTNFPDSLGSSEENSTLSSLSGGSSRRDGIFARRISGRFSIRITDRGRAKRKIIFLYHVNPIEANGDHVRAPVGLGGAGAVAGRDLPSIERHSDVVQRPLRVHSGAQVEPC